ncbi:MAG TPA: aconitate hydratase [Polyangiaceae bacterium]|jgi:aconitate hydratase|nr:aconitate hydratase [Polyangiaceae bacterium]
MTNAPIEPTAGSAEESYTTLSARLEAVRKTLRRPLTLGEKLLLGHLDDPGSDDLVPGKSYLSLCPDRVVLQDVLGQTGMLQFMQTRRDRVAVPTTIHCDHLIQARTDGLVDLRASVAENGEVYDFLRSAAARYGAGFWAPGGGIIHQVVLENYAFPGQLIIGTDSHTPNGGGLGACAVGVGGADAVEVMAGLPWQLLYPKRIGVYLTGKLGGWTAPKDVILRVAAELGVAGATNAVVEYLGPGARTLSATGKATICNMGAELGATTSVFPADERMLRYLVATERGAIADVVSRHLALLSADPEVEADPDEYYDRVVRIDLSRLEPHVAGPHTPDRARPISAFVAEARRSEPEFPEAVSAALIGSCTNSSYEDLTRVAYVASEAAAHGLTSPTALFVTPGTARVRATIERDGQLAAIRDAGAVILASACGPCIGQWRRTDAAVGTPNSIVTSYNRNFAGRNDGHATTNAFIASPELVMAFAIAGRLSFNPLTDTLIGADGEAFRLTPPVAPDVPDEPLVRDTTAYTPPDETRRAAPYIDPSSTRLARLAPWPAWDGKDFVHLPVLIKAKGKTTTDQISPAGEWLRFRGHLERFSDNLLMGALNGFTGGVGTVTNPLDGRTERVSDAARALRAKGTRWIIVADANYGEGSSREHAALSPRLLGCAAVIARSFARIHESNLKKQGLLALTFADPADYDQVREGDRITLVELANLAAGKPVKCLLEHADGTNRVLALRHSYSTAQLAWFRRGSALNAAF